jgi:hypothetical protein
MKNAGFYLRWIAFSRSPQRQQNPENQSLRAAPGGF